jgi:Na+/H+ antiporter NhaD/arsenite permease-like protein
MDGANGFANPKPPARMERAGCFYFSPAFTSFFIQHSSFSIHPSSFLPMYLTIVLFSLTYIALAIGKLPHLRCDRACIAFVGAALMLCSGILTLREAAGPDSIDYETLFLLFGMMVVVGVLRISGLFARLAHWSLDRVQSPRGLLAAVVLLSGLLSAFLVNDIVCLALTPLVLHLTRRLKMDPVPHLIGLATAANVGSTGTITGNPQNMIIGIQSHVSYARFALHLMPVALLGLVITYVVILFVYRTTLAEAPDATTGREVGTDQVPRGKAHTWLLAKSTLVGLLTIVLFFCGLPITLVAVGAAAFLMLTRIKPQRIYREVDWTLLLMFVGLFIVVHAFQVRVASHWDVEHWHIIQDHPVTLLSLAAAALSNLVSNVPAVLMFEPVLRSVPATSQQTAWLALAMSSTFAGNLTILGSVANLIVVENAKREGVAISFWEYCKAGVPITLLTLALGVGWLMFVRY